MRFLLFFAYLALEIYLIAKVADEMGILALFCEIIISAIFGFFIIASQFSAMSAYLRDIVAFNLSISSFFGRSIFRLLGAILLIMPGILSDIFGAIFFILSLFFKAKEHESNAFSGDSSAFQNNFSGFQKSDFPAQNAQEGEIIEAEIIDNTNRIENR